MEPCKKMRERGKWYATSPIGCRERMYLVLGRSCAGGDRLLGFPLLPVVFFISG
jgi:hypothetical protein